MKKLLIGLMIFSTVSSLGKSVAIKQNEVAPFNGVLLDNEDANRAKNSLQENDLLIKMNDLHDKNADIDAQKIKMLSEQNDNLAKAVQSSQEMHTWEKVAYIGLGVLAVALGGVVASKIPK